MWRRHGAGGGGASTPDRTPREIDADPGRFSCPKKMDVGVGFISVARVLRLGGQTSNPLAAAAGRQRWGHGHAVTTKFWVGEDSDNQTHLPPKFIFSSDFGHLIWKILKITMLIGVLFACIVQFSFCSFVDFACSALLMCLSALQCR